MVHIQATMFVCVKSSIKKSAFRYKEKLYRWLSLPIIIKPFSKRNMGHKGGYIAGFFNIP